ncbi:glycoside hydrolase family 43 protein [Aegicerativicinus sediminis]|uniref:glycoside hydrolase family 43 protein n=1 Tax=Aegicerativicinus sediminis TaxID=2893202 RepID=UPI001E4F67A2|nr:glycoside hydrolase family 43 protein [Aegicerativicinus sediminis]
MLKKFVQNSVIVIGVLMSCYGCKPSKDGSAQQQDLAAYLMVYFKDDDHSLHMALSTDGYNFTDINNGKAIVGGDTIASQKGIRDPHISRGEDGAFYIVMTDLHIFGKEKGFRETQWERPIEEFDWGNNRGFVLMKSYDLIHWTHSNFLFNEGFEGFDEIGCAWAPQSIYDPLEQKMMIYFTMRMNHGLTKLYYSYANDDFTKLISEPKLLFEYPNEEIQVLDADITKMPDGRYCMMYVAQEQPIGIKMAFSESLNKGYKYNDEWIDAEPGSCEAPNVWKRNNEDKWVLMYDIYSINPHNFGFLETSDFKNFKSIGHFNEGEIKTNNFTSPKHGAVISLTKDEAVDLAKHWNYNLNIK